MLARRFWLFAPLGVALGCQLVIGLDEGTVTPPGTGGSGSSSSATGTSSTTSSSSGTGTLATSSSSSTSSGSGGASSSGTSSGSGMGGGITFDIIDNMAAGNGQILKVNGRAGSWYTYNDGTGMQVPASNGPCDPVPFAVDGGPDGGPPGTTMAMHTTGTGFTSWGAGMAFDLNHPGAAPRQPYDAGAYTGFALWARSSQVPPPTLYVRLLDTETTPVGQQGTCVPPDGGPQCGDSHTVAIATLTTDWQLFVLPFTMFAQEGWGVQVTPKTLDSSKLLSTEFAVENTPDFDFWIGEVSFYTE